MPFIIKTTKAFIDFILILISFILAYFLRVGFIFSTDFPFDTYASIFIPTSIAWMLFLFFQKIYSSEPISKRRLFFTIINSNLVGITIFVLIFFYKRDIFFSRLILVYVWTIANVLLIANSWLFRVAQFHIYKKGIGTKKTLIVGANKSAEEAIYNFKKNEPYYEPVAILDAYGTKKKEILGVPVLGKMNSLEEIVKEKNIEVIVQADCIEQSLNLIHFAEVNNIDYLLIPSLLGVYKNESMSQIGKLPVISLKNK